MRTLLGCGGVFLTIVALVVAGVWIPRTFIGNGVDGFEGERREMAWAAHHNATGDIFDGDSPGVLFVHKIRVLDVRPRSSCPSLEREAEVCGEACEGSGTDALLQAELLDDGELSGDEFDVLRTSRRLEAVRGRFNATLQSYTFFGIPLRKLNMDCEGELR